MSECRSFCSVSNANEVFPQVLCNNFHFKFTFHGLLDDVCYPPDFIVSALSDLFKCVWVFISLVRLIALQFWTTLRNFFNNNNYSQSTIYVIHKSIDKIHCLIIMSHYIFLRYSKCHFFICIFIYIGLSVQKWTWITNHALNSCMTYLYTLLYTFVFTFLSIRYIRLNRFFPLPFYNKYKSKLLQRYN